MTDFKALHPAAMTAPAPWSGSALRPYLQIARVDHWFKNAFMLLGVLIALFYQPQLFALASLPLLGIAVLATCIVCSSNYVLNEWLDAPFDRLHPSKRFRPAALGQVRAPVVIVEWLVLAAIGLACGALINLPFTLSLLALWVMGAAYNIPPVRTKDIAYVDVLTESINNPLRLLLGWFALVPNVLPPLSLILAYWLVGAFFMSIKRFAEYRQIGDPAVAASYRRSFAHYDETRLLIGTMFYLTAGALFAGIFIVRYKLELILAVPAIAGFFAYYISLGLRPDSPVQMPEKLYRERGFFAYALGTTALFAVLMFVDLPVLYDLFGVTPAGAGPLWSVTAAAGGR